jgi:RNA polymerase sigma factor (sigma-70 family)
MPFLETRWTMVLSAKDGDADASSKAWEELALTYWKPVYAYLRGKGHSHQEAQDATQAFFAYMLNRDTLRNIQPEGARFRSFLLVCLNHRLIDEHRRQINVRQRAEISIEPWHEMEAINANGLLYTTAATPEEAFDRSWAEELIARAMVRLAKRWEKRADLFAELRFSVESPGDGAKYADIASRVGMTEGAVGKAAHDLRQQFVQEVRNEIRNTVAEDDDVDEELRYLASLWGSK